MTPTQKVIQLFYHFNIYIIYLSSFYLNISRRRCNQIIQRRIRSNFRRRHVPYGKVLFNQSNVAQQTKRLYSRTNSESLNERSLNLVKAHIWWRLQRKKITLPVLLIDAEGFCALDTDSNNNVRIFTLAILLSSYFLYNSIGGIDESALKNLNFVINLSKFIRLRRVMLRQTRKNYLIYSLLFSGYVVISLCNLLLTMAKTLQRRNISKKF